VNSRVGGPRGAITSWSRCHSVLSPLSQWSFAAEEVRRRLAPLIGGADPLTFAPGHIGGEETVVGALFSHVRRSILSI